MERLLAIWIKDRQVKGDVTTQDIICHKAKIIYEDLKKNIPGSSSNQDNKEDFKASRGGFLDLRKGMESTALICMVRLAVLIKKKQKSSLLIFKNLLWMKDTAHNKCSMPMKRVFSGKECRAEPSLQKKRRNCQDTKPMKDRLTLMISSNASGDLKIKPLLVLSL
ncbi:tigger transposable element-derived protein 1-like protein [Trichonephila clavata]|uniref:Tigger transposable element-derived protein 1-like protein n=1 Tax=Trichonephila clavata TaxID=2740835 RepID=A0A8X6KZ15_TRICU|nr:tigger transposable element-derived protein 1-like protein [Trichonephila clavata]